GLPVVRWSSTWSVHPRGDDHTFEHLAPGKYTLEVFKRAYRYGDRQYAAERSPIKLRLAADQDRQMTVKLKAVGPSEEEARRRWPWAVTGTVTDEQGRPLEGVQLRASCGMGTLRSTGETVTDKEGKYTLRFGPGMRVRNDATGTRRAGIQAATISASKEGHTEKNLYRQGDLLMGDKLPEEGDHYYGDRDRVVVPGKPRRLDFVMVPALSLEGEVVDERGKPIADKQLWIQGEKMRPSSSVLAGGKTDHQGRFRFEGVPPNYPWWFSIRDQGRTQPITFPGPGAYRVKLQLAHYARYNLDVFRITSVTDPQGNEVGDKLVGDDPSARPPVSEDLQEQGRGYLRKMAAASRHWLGPPPAEVRNYEYRFRLGDGEPKVYTVDDASRVAGSIRQGISYLGTPHVLASRPQKVVFRQVEVGPQTILLRFLVQDAVKITAGNGLGPWAGYFNTPLREGLIELDKTTCRPVRTDIGNVQETFSRYVGLGEGRFVPQAIRIQKGSTDWNWKFRVYQPGLWLLAEGRSGDPEGQRKPRITVDEVMINGRLAVPMVEDGTDSGTGAAREVESLQAKIREIESWAVPAKGTLRHAIENRFGKGTPSENADAPRKRGNPGSRYRLYEFCENGSLFICYDAESLAKVVWARYLDPYSVKDRATTPTAEEQLRELEPRLKQMQLILAEYKRRFGEDYRNAWGKAV
ncbi:MAG: carboxypeptidase-like regulatory domain-containing protein, partial [Planctomycetota bacterium]